MVINELKPLEQHIFEVQSERLTRIILKEETIAVPRGTYTIITEAPIEGLILYAFYNKQNSLLGSDTVTGTKQDYNRLIQHCRKSFYLKPESPQDT